MTDRAFALTIYHDSDPKTHCPHLKVDSDSPYCGRGLDPHKDDILEQRRDVCDHASLQLWCLNEGHEKCNWYKGLDRFVDQES